MDGKATVFLDGKIRRVDRMFANKDSFVGGNILTVDLDENRLSTAVLSDIQRRNIFENGMLFHIIFEDDASAILSYDDVVRVEGYGDKKVSMLRKRDGVLCQRNAVLRWVRIDSIDSMESVFDYKIIPDSGGVIASGVALV
jgi:hypothetical protein